MHKIFLFFAGAALSSFLFVPFFAQAFFSDTQNHIYEEAVNFIKERGIVQGYPDGTFRPDSTINRAELSKVVLEQNYSNLSDESCFPDVEADVWYSKYICKAKSLGIVQGYPDGLFRPADEVNFVEALKILQIAYGLEFEVSRNLWFEKSVKDAASINIIPLDILRFDSKIKRGQMADMLTRLIKYQENSLDDYLGNSKNENHSFEDIQNGINEIRYFVDRNEPEEVVQIETPEIPVEIPEEIPEVLAVCGNGIIEGKEECDGEVYCRSDCTEMFFPVCGNGILETGERCEGGDDCSETCTLISELEWRTPVCGNGVREGGEICDGGEQCAEDCTWIYTPTCGDGDIEPPEECDGEIYCDSQCKIAVQAPQAGSSCREVVSGHNNSGENRINLVFVGHLFESVGEFVDLMEKFIDYDGVGVDLGEREYRTNKINRLFGMLALEPYKSNKDLFNFWYVDEIYNTAQDDNECRRDLHSFQTLCPSENQYDVNVCKYDTTLNHPFGFGVTGEDNEVDVAAVGLFNHEVGGHRLGVLGDVSYPQLYGKRSRVNCMPTIEDARDMWSDLIGNGCGEDGVVDCLEDCYENGECLAGEYENEVQYVAVQPEDCFSGDSPISNCSLDILRTYAGDSGLIWDKHFMFKTMSKPECQTSDDHCVYKDSGQIYCFDKKLGREDLCDNLTSQTMYPDYPRHAQAVGCTFKPHLSSVMRGTYGLEFGSVNEREICNQIKEDLGSVGGVCNSKYSIY